MSDPIEQQKIILELARFVIDIAKTEDLALRKRQKRDLQEKIIQSARALGLELSQLEELVTMAVRAIQGYASEENTLEALQRQKEDASLNKLREEEEDQQLKIREWEAQIGQQNALGASLSESYAEAIPTLHATSRGTYDTDQRLWEDVNCSVFAPTQVNAGTQIMVQVFAHLAEQAKDVKEQAQESDSEATRRIVRELATKIERETKLTFELHLPGLEVEEPHDCVIWRGKPTAAQFSVLVPKDFQLQTVVGKVVIYQDAEFPEDPIPAKHPVPIGKIIFTLKVVASGSDVNTTSPVGNAQRYWKAFVSYASQDRAEVLRRVQMLNRKGVEFFQDVLHLEPGDRWEMELYKRIDESDVMYLFWSNAANRSPWVAKEWRYALEKKGLEFIQPIPIEGPPPVTPPQELAALHFNDSILYAIRVEDQIRREREGLDGNSGP